MEKPEKPETKTILIVNSFEGKTIIFMPREGQVWIDYLPEQVDSALTLDGQVVEPGQSNHMVRLNSELIYSVPQSQHNEFIYQLAWGYISE